MKNKNMNILSSIRSLSILLFLTYAMALLVPAAYAQVAKPSIDFNHMKTGFPLTGAHARVECETCHTGGLFKGTPKDCAGCHSVGRRVIAPAKSASHMLTNDACDTCHTNTITFIGARYNHLGVQPKACATCHNSRTAPNKPSGHIVTTLSCDSCHRTSAWLPAGFDHSPPLATCVTCHGPAGPAKGMPVNHVPTNGQSCDSCHTNFITFLGAIFDHTGQTQCATCHIAGTYGAKTKTAGHIPTGSISCDQCHVGTGFISFAGSTMNHNAVLATTCSTCHNGSYISQKGSLGLGAQSKANKLNHVVTTAECDTCHVGRSTFVGAYVNHLSPAPGITIGGNCNSCHDGIHALGKTATHTVTSAQCDTCHGTANNYTSFAGAAFSHDPATVTAVCGTCHLGQTAAVTKTSTHIPTVGNNCDACHVTPPNSTSYTTKFGAPTLPTMRHSAVLSIACATCHSGNYLSQLGTLNIGALAQPAGHVVTNGAACSTCHTSSDTANTWKPASYSHTGVTPTTCGTCHLTGVSGAKMKSPGHIPYNSNACDACHKSGYAIGAFASATMSHTAVSTTRCDSCHNGSYLTEGTQQGGAKAKPSNHIPTTITGSLDCNTCHTSTTLWTTEKMNHNGTTTGCKVCHNSGTTYLGTMDKKTLGNHEGSKTTDDCSQSGCHKPLGSKGASWAKWN